MARFRPSFPFAILGFALAFAAGASAQAPGADLKPGEPRLATMPATKMLVVEAKGDPATAAQAAFTKLFSTFFQIPGARMAPPRVRWIGTREAPRNQWLGLYGLPLPDSVNALPPGTEGARIEVWTYGTVAEVLYVGPYEDEAPTILKLHAFIASQGMEIAGPHEEEYLVGPGMGAAAPANYRTVIRYEVRKR